MTIGSLSQKGNGLAEGSFGPLYVPFALPGEVVALAVNCTDGTLIALKEASPERTAPACRHFGPEGVNGTCGGCVLQHASPPLYQTFKRDLVIDALKARGLTPEVAPLVTAAPGQRRRVVLTARRTEKRLILGFNQAESHHLVEISECPVASPGIIDRLETIRILASAVATTADSFRVTVLETRTGLDIAFDGAKALPNRQRRMVVESVLAQRGIARVSLNGEVLIEPLRPVIHYGDVAVTPPPGSFVQATLAAEEAMAGLVLAHLTGAKRVADLFSGSGTFALRLARQARIHAVESEDAALKALDLAARNTQGLKQVTIEKRDLFRRPLMVSELKVFDGVVFDPPRAGAEAQVKELARSGVKRIAAVSCNPATLARDLRVLVDAGYRITGVTPIDQFLWSAHVEVVATLSR